MSKRDPGRAIFWGGSAADAALRTAGAGVGGAADGATAVAAGGCAGPDTMAKNAFWAASLAASADGPAWGGVGGNGFGRMVVTERPAGMVNGSGVQTARCASTPG
jgi:hypothetical protein